MRDGETIFTAAVAIFLLAALAGDAALQGHGLRVLGFPAAIGLVTAALCFCRIVNRARTRDPAAHADSGSPWNWHAALYMLALLAVLPCVYLFGLIIGLPLHAAGCVKLRGEGWIVTIAASLTALLAASIIVVLLGVQQPRGPLVWP